jgi:hypothetical protein
MPKPKPGAVRERFIVPSIRSGDVAGAEWSNIRRFEHFLQLLNIVNDAFNVHGFHNHPRKGAARSTGSGN